MDFLLFNFWFILVIVLFVILFVWLVWLIWWFGNMYCVGIEYVLVELYLVEDVEEVVDWLWEWSVFVFEEFEGVFEFDCGICEGICLYCRVDEIGICELEELCFELICMVVEGDVSGFEVNVVFDVIDWCFGVGMYLI